jgi:hypothetical protein
VQGRRRVRAQGRAQAERDPATLEQISGTFARLDDNDPLDAACKAVLLIAFYSLTRLGEFTLKNKKALSWALHVTRASVKPAVSRAGHATVASRLSRSKSAPDGEDLILAPQRDALGAPLATCPEQAYANHLRINDPSASSEVLFSCTKWRNGQRTPLTKAAFLARIKKAAAHAGCPTTAGHAFRIGGTIRKFPGCCRSCSLWHPMPRYTDSVQHPVVAPDEGVGLRPSKASGCLPCICVKICSVDLRIEGMLKLTVNSLYCAIVLYTPHSMYTIHYTVSTS